MPPKKAIAKKSKNDKPNKQETPSTNNVREEPPAGAVLVSASTQKAIVVLPDGVKHADEKTFYFYDETDLGGETSSRGNQVSELILFRGYALPSTSLNAMQKAVGGYIEYVPGKPCAALQKAGFKALACNEEGRFSCADQFNVDASAFMSMRVQLFGPVILMKKME